MTWPDPEPDTPIYDQMRREGYVNEPDDQLDLIAQDPFAQTAAEQDHSDPWAFAGDETTPPDG